jgi:hypothetical protein
MMNGLRKIKIFYLYLYLEVLITPNYISIKILGSWNLGIFEPFWVSKFLFQKEDLELKLYYNPSTRSIDFEYENLKIHPRENEFLIELIPFEYNGYKNALNVLSNLLLSLPHTPIIAAGINFHYSISKESKDIELIKWLNKRVSNFNDFSVNQLILTKIVEKSTLNIICEMDSENYKLIFNYHFNKENFIILPRDNYLSLIKETQSILESKGFE